jgi:D-arabinose 1-dehydrogenase-like Zn-dependent alcohol dehydrogenase
MVAVMSRMKVAQVKGPGSGFEVVERDVPEPGPGTVRIRVEACGLCHSDAFVKEGHWPGLQYPRVPGHEVAGVVDEVGPGVVPWRKGQRVGVGWHGGHCGHCRPCRAGDFITCETLQIAGIAYDGGYGEYMIARAEALASIPATLSPEEAAPLLCAGITTFNALRHGGAQPGDLVAVQGIGGLGHLGIQFAAKLGFDTVAISRGRDKEPLARELGARRYLDTDTGDPAQELAKLGGARVILATAPNAKAISALVDGLGVDGRLIVVAASPDPIQVTPIQLIGKRRSIQGWPSGTSRHSEETLAFAALTGVRPMTERFPLARVGDAYESMIANRVRFRAVLAMGT